MVSFHAFLLPLCLLLQPILSLTNCGTITIKCNSNSGSCYSGKCAKYAPYFSGINELPIVITQSPTSDTLNPSISPSNIPSTNPSISPSLSPTLKPSLHPTTPTLSPSIPSSSPTQKPVIKPTNRPIFPPTFRPTLRPTIRPTNRPFLQPSSPFIAPQPTKRHMITLTDADKNFALECGLHACDGLEIIIKVTAGVSTLSAIDCLSTDACNGTSINVINEGNNPLTILSVECEGLRACQNTKFSFFGDVSVAECDCTEDAGCETITGLTCPTLEEGDTLSPTKSTTTTPTIFTNPSSSTQKPTLNTQQPDPCQVGYVHPGDCNPSPCDIHTCNTFPDAICTNNYCGGCHAIFTRPNGQRLTAEQCVDTVIINNPTPQPTQLIAHSPTVKPTVRTTPTPTISTKDVDFYHGHEHDIYHVEELCGGVGDHCTSAHPRHQRCCNPEVLRCYYHKWGEVELFGHKVGICCVRPNRFGCTDFDDCCGDDKVCHQGYCLRADDEFMGNALIIKENGQWADWSETKEEIEDDVSMKTFVFGASKGTLYVIAGIVMFCVCCNAIFCCMKRGMAKDDECEDEYDTDEDDRHYMADNAMSQSDNQYKRRYVI